MEKKYDLSTTTKEIFEKADFLTEEAVKVAAYGNIAIKKEDLYERLYPMFIERLLNKYERGE